MQCKDRHIKVQDSSVYITDERWVESITDILSDISVMKSILNVGTVGNSMFYAASPRPAR